MWQAISQQLSDTLLFNFQITERIKVSGGGIDDCYMISDGNERYFVKVNQREFLPKFEIEAENLRLLRETSTVYVPELVLFGKTKGCSFIILNYLPIKPLETGNNSFDFGVQLARLHLWGEQKEFGYDQDNYIGSTLQPNHWHKKWGRFFSEQRIGFQLQLLKEKGIEFGDIDDIVDVINMRLAGHNPRPSLLHGDLWHDNVANSAFGPICYDPACYWGDHECDLALTELFDGFPKEFYEGYQSVHPLDSGYTDRKDIYNLYHLLNHCNQFGGDYLAQTEACIQKIQAV